MKLTLLGTAAAEGVPSLFCDCEMCNKARELKGKNLRRRSSLFVNDDLIIDMGPDLYSACTDLNIDLRNLKYALITHCHFDHFYPENIEIRSRRYQLKHFPTLKLLANSSVFFKLSQMGYKDDELYVERIEANLYKEFKFGDYRVMPIPANHAHEFGMALNYIIKYEGKCILYATDSGIYEPEWLDQLNKEKFDCIILDATNVFTDTSKNHLNIKGIKTMIQEMYNREIIDLETIKVCTHFSHFGLPTHVELESKLLAEGIIAAYDGMVIDL